MGLMSIAQALMEAPHHRMAKMTLFAYAGDLTPEGRDFQFWPESISDTISVDYANKQVAGGSHALKHWVSNQGRTLSFTVMLARDMGRQADVPALFKPVNPQSDERKQWNRDVRQDIAWLRSFCYPTYGRGASTVASPPPLAFLQAEGMGLAHDGGDGIFCVMTSCTVNYVRTFENGIPRQATVDLSFDEVVQKDGLVEFHNRDDIVNSKFFRRTDADVG